MGEFGAFLKLREHLYKMLSYAFYMEPDEEYIADVKNSMAVFKSAAEADGSSDMLQGVELMEKFFSSGSTSLDELACAFARIFLVMNAELGIKSVSPCESAYLSPEGLLMQNERDEVMFFYAKEGVAKDKELFREPEDHIGAELFFMASMSRKTFDAMEKGDENEAAAKIAVQYDFLNSHIMKWIDPLCADLYNIADNDFYKGIAKLANGFIRWDFEKLECILNRKENKAN